MLRFIHALIVVVTAPCFVLGSDATETALVGDLLNTICDVRNGIQSGHFVATGFLANDVLGHPLRMEVWFCGDNWRVDLCSVPAVNASASTNRRRIFKRGSSCVVETNGLTESASEKEATSFANYFDVRSLGLADSYDMKRAASIDQVIQVFKDSGIPIGLERQSGGLLQLTRGPLPSGGTQVITIDPYRGYVPLESRLFHGPGNQQLVQSAWDKVDEVWVPIGVRIRSRSVLKVDLRLDWKSVNADMHASIFETRILQKSSKRTARFAP